MARGPMIVCPEGTRRLSAAHGLCLVIILSFMVIACDRSREAPPNGNLAASEIIKPGERRQQHGIEQKQQNLKTDASPNNNITMCEPEIQKYAIALSSKFDRFSCQGTTLTLMIPSNIEKEAPLQAHATFSKDRHRFDSFTSTFSTKYPPSEIEIINSLECLKFVPVVEGYRRYIFECYEGAGRNRSDVVQFGYKRIDGSTVCKGENDIYISCVTYLRRGAVFININEYLRTEELHAILSLSRMMARVS
jgi:hypothetical protein